MIRIASPSKTEQIITEAVKIYFDYNCTAKEAVERAKEIYEIQNNCRN